MFDRSARLRYIASRLLFSLLLSLLVVACAGSDSEKTHANHNMVPINVSLVSAPSSQEKATSENLLDLNRAWTRWNGTDSGIRFDASTETLTIPMANGDAMAIGVQRYELPLTEGASYTLIVTASDQAAAALIFLFDRSGSIVPLTDTQSGLSSAQPGAPLTFTAPADIAGFYIQVQNAWQATRATNLTARFTVEVDDPVGNGTELLTLSGLWSDWSGEFNGVGYLIDPKVIQIRAPDADAGNRYGMRRFDQALSAGQTYQLRTLNASDPGATTLLFLTDANSALIPFTNPTTGDQQNWLSASPNQPIEFVAPAGVTGFAIQVQSAWGQTETTTLVPSLIAVSGDLSCDQTLQRLGDTTNFSSQTIDQPADHTISDDGQYAAFVSFDESVIAGQTLAVPRAYWQDLNTGTIKAIIPQSSALGRPDVQTIISGDGRYVFLSTTRGTTIDGIASQSTRDLFRYERATETFTRITPEIADTLIGRIVAVSTNGTKVLFYGNRATLVGDTTVYGAQLLEYSFTGDSITPVSLPDQTSIDVANASSDLRYLVFYGLVGDPREFNDQGQMIGLRTTRAYLLDRTTGLISEVADTGSARNAPAYTNSELFVSSGGKYVVFKSDLDLLDTGRQSYGHYRWQRADETLELVPFELTRPSGSTRLRSITSDGQIATAYYQNPDVGGNSISLVAIRDLRNGTEITIDSPNLFQSHRLSRDGSRVVYFSRDSSSGKYASVVTETTLDCD